MKQALEDYYRDVEERAATFTRKEEIGVRADHLDAFNLGRRIQRIEHSRLNGWIRVGWLLAGLVIGVACGRMYPDHAKSASAQKLLVKATATMQGAEKAALAWLGEAPR